MSKNTHRLAFHSGDITSAAYQILDLRPDPAPRYRILRDLLRCEPDDASLQESERNLYASKWVVQLAETQQPDGTWGRFHSQDARVKGPFPTTEYAIRRALALGFDRRSPVLQKAAGFIRDHLQGRTTWSDPPEKHDDPKVFPHNIRSVSAAMLALIDRHDPLLDPFWQHWREILVAAFASGTYDANAELSRHQALSGIPSRRLSPFHIYYPLLILSATKNRLAPDLEKRMLAFLLQKPDGIYYICSKPLDNHPRPEVKGFLSWLHGQEVLARFDGWKAFAPDILNWIWSQRGENGLWDMGNGLGHTYDFPLSESWRRSGNRAIDCSVQILCLLQCCLQ